jgi:hypothetical protein
MNMQSFEDLYNSLPDTMRAEWESICKESAKQRDLFYHLFGMDLSGKLFAQTDIWRKHCAWIYRAFPLALRAEILTVYVTLDMYPTVMEHIVVKHTQKIMTRGTHKGTIAITFQGYAPGSTDPL